MGAIGYLTTLLSLLYHRGYERRFILSEGLCAKASIALVVYHGLRLKLRTIDAVLPSALVFVLWRLSQHCNYERWHPWMHLVVAADVHYFLAAHTFKFKREHGATSQPEPGAQDHAGHAGR